MPKVLVVEDERSILEEVMEWLQFEGYDVVGAGNGRLGVDAAQRELPNVIICDISMPEMDGYQVLLALREHPETKSIPFIFLTAHADRTFMRHGMELGADDYLTKPFTRNELLSALKARLERQTAVIDSLAQNMEKTKLELARLIAHELKTPISSMQFVRQVIDRQIDHLEPEELKDLLQTLNSGTDRLSHLVEQLVYWTRLETNVLTEQTIQMSDAMMYMWQIIPAAVNVARRFAYRNQNAEIMTDLRDGEASVWGQIEPLRHALAELISNALNFSSETSTISISQWLAGEHVIISILDAGRGMSEPEKDQAQIPFQQVNRQQNEQQGMGLGLNVARRLITIYGGTMQLNSVAGKGTQIEITLPLAHEA